MSIEASKLVKEVLRDLADSTRTSYLITLNRFVNEFVTTCLSGHLFKQETERWFNGA